MDKQEALALVKELRSTVADLIPNGEGKEIIFKLVERLREAPTSSNLGSKLAAIKTAANTVHRAKRMDMRVLDGHVRSIQGDCASIETMLKIMPSERGI